MAKKSEKNLIKKDLATVLTRNLKLLLYPDNEQHVQAVEQLRLKYKNHLGILHKGYEGKKDHWHFAVKVGEVPVRVGTFCRALGLVNDLGEPDTQFVRLIGGRINSFLVYLTHLSEPDKEQYSPSDLFGSPEMIAQYGQAATKYIRKDIDMQDAVIAVMDWLKWQEGIVRLSTFARWITQTPYFKASSSPLVRGLIEEHNRLIYDSARRNYISSLADSSEKRQALLQYPETFDDFSLSSQLDPDDFEPLY